MDMLIITVASAGTVLSIVFAVALVRLTFRLTELEIWCDTFRRSFARLFGILSAAKEIARENQRGRADKEDK